MVDFTKGVWLHEPKNHEVSEKEVIIITEPCTDFWQRSYYGFRNDNAPVLQLSSSDNFSFTTKVEFEYQTQFDQCGVMIYLDSENWFKASIEYECASFSRLGSVVTNHGYSDWATTDITLPESIWYRLHRRGPDFLIETSLDGKDFKQMRVFHLHVLGETSAEMGKTDPPIAPSEPVSFGLYACSPQNASFTAKFSDMKLEACLWPAHQV